MQSTNKSCRIALRCTNNNHDYELEMITMMMVILMMMVIMAIMMMMKKLKEICRTAGLHIPNFLFDHYTSLPPASLLGHDSNDDEYHALE